MFKVKKQVIACSLILGLVISSIYLVSQVYDFRISFSEIEELNKKQEDLSFQSNLLLNEVEYFRNQLTIRKKATESLGMRPPLLKEQVTLFKEVSKS